MISLKHLVFILVGSLMLLGGAHSVEARGVSPSPQDHEPADLPQGLSPLAT